MMSTEKLTFEIADKLGKLLYPIDVERILTGDVLSVSGISAELGIHLNTIKRWIAESVFVDGFPTKFILTENFSEEDGELLEILAFYVRGRLSVTGYVKDAEPAEAK